jgi:hypothetical protein
MAVNDQAVDRGECAAKPFPMRTFKPARHVHLSEEVIMSHTCPDISRSVLAFSVAAEGCAKGCEAVPAFDLAGAGMRRHVYSGNHAAESLVSFIPLFGRSMPFPSR